MYTCMYCFKHMHIQIIYVFLHVKLCLLIYTLVHTCDFCLTFSHFSFLLSSLVHRQLDVFGNPLGCVQGVPDSVTSFDNNAVWYGYYETARCGDNCTQHTVYVPNDGVCVQCPDGTHAHGVGALNCSVVSPTRCSLMQLSQCSVMQCGAVWCSVVQCGAVQCPRGVLWCNSPVAVFRCVCFFCMFMYGYEFIHVWCVCVFVHVFVCVCVGAFCCIRVCLCVCI